MDINKHLLSGIKWTSLSTLTNALIQLVQIAILARYLDAGDFGLMAMVGVVIGFSQTFVDLGISSAIIHHQNMTSRQLSTLYWLNLLMAVVIYLLILLFSPYIADFYHESRLETLIVLVGSTIIIQSLGKQFFVLFEKKLQFDTLAKIDIFSALSGFMIAVYLAMNGYGVLALVYPFIVVATLKSFFWIVLGMRFHRPGLFFELSEVYPHLRFGLYQTGSGIVNYFNSQFDVIIIGKVLGTDAVGVYSLIKQIIMRPAQIINPIVTRIAFPTMAKIQNDMPRLKKLYIGTINLLSSVNFPIYGLMILLAPEIISLFLGQRWVEHVILFQILALFALIRSTGNPIGSLVLARGKPEYELYWNIGLFVYLPIGLWVGSTYGLHGAAWALTVMMWTLVVPNWYFLVRRLCGAAFWEYHRVIFKPLAAAVLTTAVVYQAAGFMEVGGDIVKILLVLLSYLPLYWLVSRYVNKEVFSFFRNRI